MRALYQFTGWYFVSLDDEQGWVPCSYLEPLHGGEQDVVTEKCLTGMYELVYHLKSQAGYNNSGIPASGLNS